MGEFHESEALHPSRGGKGKFDAAGVGEEVVEDEALEPAHPGGWMGMNMDADFERFDEAPILDAGGAGGFTGAAVEAEFEVVTDVLGEGDAAIDDIAHEVDASAGRIVFIAGFDVGGAARGAEAAVDAFLEAAVIDPGLEPCEVDAGLGDGGERRGEVDREVASRVIGAGVARGCVLDGGGHFGARPGVRWECSWAGGASGEPGEP
jgi:hypothetical protein